MQVVSGGGIAAGYDAEKDQWYFNGEEVRYFRDVLTSNGESLTSGKFQGEMRTLGSGVGTIDIYTVRDYGHLNSEHHGTLTGIEKYSQEEFDEHIPVKIRTGRSFKSCWARSARERSGGSSCINWTV